MTRPPLLRIGLDELVVDSFAGGGGASTGIEAALGRPVDIAINHDPEAIEMHRRNHPHTEHYLESVWKVDPKEATQGRPVGLAWFSPSCTHHSRAKGGKPLDTKIRSLAWVVLRWARAVRPRVIMLENVPEFRSWSPVVDGKADPARSGRTFRMWSNQLRGLGYQVEFRELVAADYGTPTTRRRLFMVARCDGAPVVWPEQTHGRGTGRAWIPASDIIDWSLPMTSVYDRERPLCAATMRRIDRGMRQYTTESLMPQHAWIAKYYGSGVGQSLDEPLHTVTTVARFGLVKVERGDVLFRMLAPRELFNAQGFPTDYDIGGMTKTAAIAKAGNSVCPPVAQAIVEANCVEQEQRRTA